MLKRFLDAILALTALLILSPLFLLLAVLIRFDSEGAVFFRQARVGRHGRTFRIWKFRTMIPNAEAMGSQITGKKDPRVTQDRKSTL